MFKVGSIIRTATLKTVILDAVPPSKVAVVNVIIANRTRPGVVGDRLRDRNAFIASWGGLAEGDRHDYAVRAAGRLSSATCVLVRTI
jgi:cation transport ATPase